VRRALALALLVACGEPAAPVAPPPPTPERIALPVADEEVAPAPDGEAFDAPLAPGALAVDVCTLDAVIGVEADGPAIGPIARRGDGTLVLVMDEQLALLRPTAGRDCRFEVTVLPRPGLRGADASVAADRGDDAAVWLADQGSLLRIGGTDEGAVAIDRAELVAHPAGGVWASVRGRWTWLGGPAGEPQPVAGLPRGITPLALIAPEVLVAARGEGLVRVPIGGAPIALGASATLARAIDAGLVVAAPRSSTDLRVLGADGAELRTIALGGLVDLALGLGEPTEAPCAVTGLTEVTEGAAHAALETVQDGVRLAVVARIRGL
jgi:hypothetical protein